MHRLQYCFIALVLLSCEAPMSSEEQAVHNFTAAFSRHDVDAMMTYLADEAAWMSVIGDTLTMDAMGKDAIRSAMEGYFQQIPDVESSIESAQVLPPFVTAIERVAWNGGTNTQRAVAVYEVRDDLIVRVWYHAAVR